jgi:hypothetical protein
MKIKALTSTRGLEIVAVFHELLYLPFFIKIGGNPRTRTVAETRKEKYLRSKECPLLRLELGSCVKFSVDKYPEFFETML